MLFEATAYTRPDDHQDNKGDDENEYNAENEKHCVSGPRWDECGNACDGRWRNGYMFIGI